MKKLSNYIPYILIVVAMFVGRWTSPKPDKELMQKYESERKYHLSQIDSLKGKSYDLLQAGLAIRENMHSDSLKFSSDLRANKEAYLKLKKKYNEINLSRANAQSLDSIVSRLYPD